MSKKMRMTNAGNTLRLDALGGTPIQFTRLVLGDGQLTTQEPASLTEVIHEVLSIAITADKCRVVDGHFEFATPFDRTQIPAAFRWRELALYAYDPSTEAEIAFAYGNDYDEGEYITPDTSGTFVEEEIHISAFVGEATVQCAYDTSAVWVTKKQMEDWQTEQNVLYANTLYKALNTSLAHKAGQMLLGPASLINELEPGGVLLVTDDQDPSALAVTLDRLIDEAYKINSGGDSALTEILTPALMASLNLRKNSYGEYYDLAELDALKTALTELTKLAVELGYVDNNGAPVLSWSQTQHYLISGLLLTASEAAAEIYPWETTLSADVVLAMEAATLQGVVDTLQSTMDDAADDINAVVYGEED